MTELNSPTELLNYAGPHVLHKDLKCNISVDVDMQCADCDAPRFYLYTVIREEFPSLEAVLESLRISLDSLMSQGFALQKVLDDECSL